MIATTALLLLTTLSHVALIAPPADWTTQPFQRTWEPSIAPTPSHQNGTALVADNDGKPKLTTRFYPEGYTGFVSYSPNGKILAVAGGRDDVKLLDPTTGKLIKKLNMFTEEEDAEIDIKNLLPTISITTLAFSPDSTVLAVGNNIGQVKLFEVESGLAMFSLDGVKRDGDLTDDFFKLRLAHGNVSAIAFSPDGSLIATSGGAIDYQRDGVDRLRSPVAGILKIWDFESGKLKADLKNQHSGHVSDVAFARDGKLLATAGHFVRSTRGGTGMKIWDTSKLKIKSIHPLPSGTAAGSVPHCLGVSTDGKRLAMGVWKFDKATDERTGSVHVYYPASGIMDLSWTVPIQVRQVAFTPDDKYIATRTGAAEITMRDASTGVPKHVLTPLGNAKKVRWTSFSFSPTENVVAIGGNDGDNRRCVEIWSLEFAK